MQKHLAHLRMHTERYAFWKGVARSGERGVRYYAYQAGGFVLDGEGAPRLLEHILSDTDGTPGLYFFDTVDGEVPEDRTADGRPDNLTPAVRLSGGMAVRGFVFMNAERFSVAALSNELTVRVRAPQEPHTPDHEAWIDLRYPDGPSDGFLPGPPDGWDRRGPQIEAAAAFRGILVTTGVFEAFGGGAFYGNVVAGSVLLDGEFGAPTRFFRDIEVEQDGFPPHWEIPRLRVGRWAPD